MKKGCKHIDIKDWQQIYPFVYNCVMRHKKKHDFRNLLFKHGLKKAEYKSAFETHDYSAFIPAIQSISKYVADCIRNRQLVLRPVRIRIRTDLTSGKIREIGDESALQQVFDYVAVFSCDDIWRKRIVLQQVSSLLNRGQIKGVSYIRKWVNDDNRCMRYAKSHHLRYTSKCKYFAKLDIKKCYPSARMDIFMQLFKRDCGNDDIIWLWQTLLESHHVQGYQGFMIGALISMYACQYMISFIYRKAMTARIVKRGKSTRVIHHMITFMDDMLLIGSNRKLMTREIKDLITYSADVLGFTIKPTWHIHCLDEVGIDMMGFVVYRSGRVVIRGKDFIKARRGLLRYKRSLRMNLNQATHLVAYKGFFKHSDTQGVQDRLNAPQAFHTCSRIISKHAKEMFYYGKSNV